MPPDVWYEWNEKVPANEITHQLEPGQPHPMRLRRGVGLGSPTFQTIYYPSGRTEDVAVVFVYDATVPQVLMKTFSQVRAIWWGSKPANEAAKEWDATKVAARILREEKAACGDCDCDKICQREAREEGNNQ